jgi:hypothetical protein
LNHPRIVLCGCACWLAALALPASAGAVTTIGSDLSSDKTVPYDYGGVSYTLSQNALPGRPVSSPINGVVVRWRVRSSSGLLTFRVLRPAGVSTATGAGSSSQVSVASMGVETFATRLPIQAGDRIGVDLSSPGSSVGARTPAMAFIDNWAPSLADGETRGVSGGSAGEILLNADLEPDGDGDGFGDETQDGCVGQAGPDGGCPLPPDTSAPDTTITKRPKDKSKHKQATFEFSSSEPGSSFECKLDNGAFAPCSSPDELKVGKGKHHFEVRARDAAGNVDPTPATDDWKVKKKK